MFYSYRRYFAMQQSRTEASHQDEANNTYEEHEGQCTQEYPLRILNESGCSLKKHLT
jgi:hypothetical protein